jgi:hypothetical protein
MLIYVNKSAKLIILSLLFVGLVAGAKETGFLWLLSKDNCNIPKKKPGFWVWSLGLVGGAKETGFLSWFPKITVISRKETRFLGEVSGFGRWGERNRVSVVQKWG